jgi:hypothetical protein
MDRRDGRLATHNCRSAARIAGGEADIEHRTLAMLWLGVRAACKAAHAQQPDMPDSPDRKAVTASALRVPLVYVPRGVRARRAVTELTPPWGQAFERIVVDSTRSKRVRHRTRGAAPSSGGTAVIKRRDTLALAAATALPLGAPAAPAPVQGGGQPLRVLRYAFPIAESGFDPAQISDA